MLAFALHIDFTIPALIVLPEKKLIDPSLDAQVWARTKAAHKARWEVPNAPRAVETQSK